MNPMSRRSSCALAWGLAPLLLWLGGCHTPCQKLGALMCKHLPKKHVLCTIVREESQRKEATYRRCRALTETWNKEGARQLKAYVKRYKQYRDRVGRRHTMHRGLQLMALEHKRFRRLVQKLLRLPIKTSSPASSTPPPRRPKDRKRPK